MNKVIFNNRVERIHAIVSPKEMIEKLSADDESYSFILESRKTISNILKGQDDKFLLIVGPCSIHDVDAAIEYAEKLSKLKKKYNDKFFIVMRSYFEKPRTALGWRGLIVEPNLDGVINISAGLEKARKFLIHLAKLKIPAAVELVDPIIPQYLADLVSWASVGARSAESQMHRELASGLSMPVGFKNTTSGEIGAAINGILVSSKPHAFLSVERNGLSAIVHTIGNLTPHLVLRGGKCESNCDRKSILNAVSCLEKQNLLSNILVDCSHANSQKIPANQIKNFHSLVEMRFNHSNAIKNIRGCMMESFLKEGRCDLNLSRQPENYGRSITDACLSWESTELAINDAYKIIMS